MIECKLWIFNGDIIRVYICIVDCDGYIYQQGVYCKVEVYVIVYYIVVKVGRNIGRRIVVVCSVDIGINVVSVSWSDIEVD